MSSVRPAHRAGSFYPGEFRACTALLDDCLERAAHPIEFPPAPVAAVVPHAGWVYSGAVAAGALRSLATRTASTEVVVLFGAVHVPGVCGPTRSPDDAWATPLGEVPVHAVASELLRGLCPAEASAHAREHSIEVQVPFVSRLFPAASICPIAIPATQEAAGFGAAVAEALSPLGDRVVFLGSTDMSHYGRRFGFADHGKGATALAWVRDQNDARMLRLIEGLDAEAVVPEAHAHSNACGAGALAATLAAARTRGRSRGTITGYTTSADVTGEVEPTDFVGYGGAVL